ncbi:phosphodiester glycosidase family protein [Pedobacter glucosidilyticus]|uniref:phosphodiester glycosidase family protein n=1 Tax=Pedobacter glucosidilyticus TaxID=1122941 RepID=UPI0026F0157A|nr:phosphodiester glycosidase family protein [Pedobacter glucosidilyticus]
MNYLRGFLMFCFLLLSSDILTAQSLIVNRYFNSGTGDGTGDVVELVVITDKLDIRKWFIKDHGNGTAAVGGRLDEGGAKIRFNDIPLWSNLRSGTVIVLRRLTATQAQTFVSDADASDYIIDLSINDSNYFTDLLGNAFNVTPHEAVMVRADVTDITPTMTLTEKNAILNGANKAVHALAYGDFMTTALNSWNNIRSPKAIFSNGTISTNYVGNGTIGMVSLTNPNQPNYTTPLTKSTPLITGLPNYWIQESALTANMPYGIEVYRSTTDYSFNGGPTRKMNAYMVVVDPKFVDFKPTHSVINKTASAFVNDEPGTVLAVMNAGFFQAQQNPPQSNNSFSMLRYQGVTPAHNIGSLTRSFNGSNTSYFPTRAAFGLAPNLLPDVAWVYNISGVVYSYSTPSPNLINTAPQPQPTSTGGVIWNNVTAVGGAPMLIKNGNVNVTDAEELIVIDNTSARARSAIGYTADGKIIMLVAEGGNSGVSDGLNLVELANYMKDIGCVGAINLDGGSSSTLRVNNQQMIRPSSGGNEQPMPGVILIKAKN